jgi:hypothetical protein
MSSKSGILKSYNPRQAQSYKSELANTGFELAARFDGLRDVPRTCVSGSVGDLYGCPTDKSDLDINAWVTNPLYLDLNNYPIDWNPYTLKKKKDDPKGSGGVIEDLGTDDGLLIQVLYRMLDLEGLQKEIEAIKGTPTREQLDRCISMYLERTFVKDETALCKPYGEKSKESFGINRGHLGQQTFDEIRDPWEKLSDTRKVLTAGKQINFETYNSMIKEIVNLLTYVQCCANDLPRSYRNLEFRRKDRLWEALGMNRGLLLDALELDSELEDEKPPSIETACRATEATRELVANTYENSRKELPELEVGSHVIKMIMDDK